MVTWDVEVISREKRRVLVVVKMLITLTTFQAHLKLYSLLYITNDNPTVVFRYKLLDKPRRYRHRLPKLKVKLKSGPVDTCMKQDNTADQSWPHLLFSHQFRE